MIDWFVKNRKVIEYLKVSEGRGKVVYGPVKVLTKCEVGDARGKVVDKCVKLTKI